MGIHLMKYKDVIQQVRHKRRAVNVQGRRMSYSKCGKRIIIDMFIFPTTTSLALTSGELWP